MFASQTGRGVISEITETEFLYFLSEGSANSVNKILLTALKRHHRMTGGKDGMAWTNENPIEVRAQTETAIARAEGRAK